MSVTNSQAYPTLVNYPVRASLVIDYSVCIYRVSARPDVSSTEMVEARYLRAYFLLPGSNRSENCKSGAGHLQCGLSRAGEELRGLRR